MKPDMPQLGASAAGDTVKGRIVQVSRQRRPKDLGPSEKGHAVESKAGTESGGWRHQPRMGDGTSAGCPCDSPEAQP